MTLARAALVVASLVALAGSADAQVILRRPGEPLPTLPRSHGQVPRPAGERDPDAPYVLTVRVFVTPQEGAPAPAGPGVALLLTDAGGRRVGRDPFSDAAYAEIPDAAYEPVTNPDPSAPVGPRGLAGIGITLRQPGEGRYALDVIGRASVRFDYVLQAWDRTGRARWTHLGYGFTEPGGVDSFDIDYALSLTPPIWISERRDNSYLSVHVYDEGGSGRKLVADALLVDPRGRRLGVSAAGGAAYAEIPRAGYAADATDTPMVEIEVPRPLPGVHVVDVVGTRRGRYTIEVRGVDATDASGHDIVSDVPTAKGLTHRYRVELGAAPAPPLRVGGALGGALLSWASPAATITRVPASQATFAAVVFYGVSLDPATLRATLNGADATARFSPRPGAHEVVTLPLRPGANVLTVSAAAATGAAIAAAERLEIRRGSGP